jgi:hypothetical protein
MTLDQLTTEGAGTGSAEITGGTVREPICAARARRIACDAGLLPAVLSGASVVMDWGTSKRTATPAQRQALALRDKGCCHPTCDRPPSWCQAHHLTPWLDHGPSNLTNYALVCDAHHDLLHHDGWTIHLDHQGQPLWTGPDAPLPPGPDNPDNPDPAEPP